ncbi:hypothetical protein [Natrialba sp. SSL1]|uniref:hypothetical protein n=1 Tax=Natrialba sp. SSL1 TaxID=1869245 RepID=UPI0008F87DF1|nr:hypothetical protein [Natrialba sp. SSL1]OIB56441.1 hypothetical protein BBD46_17585 [Natrialba sp. SSL1]
MAYERQAASGFQEIDRWEDGVGWLAHPDELGQRASHAVVGEAGVWLLDPLWAPGVDDLIDDLAEEHETAVAGVAICSCWHTRDAEQFARRYDVPITIPEWMGRVDDRTTAPIERYADSFDPVVEVVRRQPIPLWDEAILYWDNHQTLYTPESIGTADPFLVDDERLGLELFFRLDPPHSLREYEPDRVIVGHGTGIFDDATRALEYALAGARRRFPRAVLENGPGTARSLVGALR